MQRGFALGFNWLFPGFCFSRSKPQFFLQVSVSTGSGGGRNLGLRHVLSTAQKRRS
jgi:hypothetical protein